MLKQYLLTLSVALVLCSCTYYSEEEYPEMPVINNPAITGDQNQLGVS